MKSFGAFLTEAKVLEKDKILLFLNKNKDHPRVAKLFSLFKDGKLSERQLSGISDMIKNKKRFDKGERPLNKSSATESDPPPWLNDLHSELLKSAKYLEKLNSLTGKSTKTESDKIENEIKEKLKAKREEKTEEIFDRFLKEISKIK